MTETDRLSEYHQTIMKFKLTILSILAVMFVLAGCGPTETAATDAPKTDAPKADAPKDGKKTSTQPGHEGHNHD